MRAPLFLVLLMVPLVAAWHGALLADEGHDVYQSASDVPYTNIKRHRVASNILQDSYVVDVALPVNYHETSDSHTYPVIVVMDAEFLFPVVSGLVHQMVANSQMPESIVVGVMNAPGKRRDITPKPFNRQGQPYWFGGKEDHYLQFLTKELLPLISRTYRAADFRTLMGLSPTAQFALHGFWKAPGAFDAVIALNATDFTAVGYEGQSVFEKIEMSLEKAEKGPRFLYVSMPQEGVQRNPAIAEAYKSLRNRLAAFADHGLKVKTDVIDQKAYAAAVAGVMNAFEMIFPSEAWDVSYRSFVSETEGQTLANLKAFFAELSASYGFTVLPKGERFYNRNRLKRLGYYLLQNSRAEEAVAIFKYWIDLYPNAANAYDSLADAYRVMGQQEEAVRAREKAIQLANENEDFRVPIFERKRSDIETR